MVELVLWEAEGKLFQQVLWPEAPWEFRIPVLEEFNPGLPVAAPSMDRMVPIQYRRFMRMDDWNPMRQRAHYMEEKEPRWSTGSTQYR